MATETKKWCKTCWNTVGLIPEAKRVIGRGKMLGKWVHLPGAINRCEDDQLTDEQVTSTNPRML